MNLQQLYQTALQHHRNHQLAQAEALYRQLLSLQPEHADTLHLLGVLLHQTERSAQAVDYISMALKISPHNADYLNNLGLALRADKQHEAALQSYQKALKVAPKDLDIQTNIANLYFALKRFEEAAGHYRRVLRAQPKDADIRAALCHALQKMGSQYQTSGSYFQAEACFQEAVRLEPGNAALFYNLGNAQRELGKAAEAAENYRIALKLVPDDADTHNNLGNVLRELGQLEEAIQCYETAIRLDPQLFHAKVHWVHLKQQVCDWAGLDSEIDEIRQWIHTQPQAQISPFAFLAMPATTAAEQRNCADNWVNNRYQNLYQLGRQLAFTYPPKTGKKLRIGYLSSDFRLHPLAFLITDLIKLHDRKLFEIFAYSAGADDKSPERKQLTQAFDHFVDIRTLSLVDAANKINKDRIDILVDLTGFTHTSRSGIVTLRAAPINVNWLGFPGTMGGLKVDADYVPLFDYLITDATITPAELAPHFAEKLVMLPDCYQPNSRHRPLGKPVSRANCQLPENAFVYCCFNQSFKISSQLFEIWMNLLKAKEGSVLWLLESHATAKTNLFSYAEKSGVDKSRLIFAPRVPIADHLARHSCADLFLDTLPYNAHTTASDALWMGLPVLTCQGGAFAGRVAASILKAAGLPELITHTLAEYQALALQLASQPDKMAAIRHKLSTFKDQAALFEPVRFARQLELNYQEMWKIYLQLNPQSDNINN